MYIWILTLISCVCAVPSSVFVAFGDWGEKSDEMTELVGGLVKEKPEFVVLLGDNFYPKGVRSVHDPQFRMFDKFSSVAEKFYAILGNHDYGYSESRDAQIAFSKVNPKWHMPHQFYSKPVHRLGNSGYSLCMLFLDTHVFEPDQMAWLGTVLGSSECQGDKSFRIVFGHHPIHTAGLYSDSREVASIRKKIEPVLKKYNVNAYISGHEHQMQAIESGGIHYIVSGATAQMNRAKGKCAKDLSGKLGFFHDSLPGYLRVRFEEPVLVYEFVAEGHVLYSGVIQLTKRVAKTTVPPTTTPKPALLSKKISYTSTPTTKVTPESTTGVPTLLMETTDDTAVEEVATKKKQAATVIPTSHFLKKWKEWENDGEYTAKMSSDSLTKHATLLNASVCFAIVLAGYLYRV